MFAALSARIDESTDAWGQGRGEGEMEFVALSTRIDGPTDAWGQGWGQGKLGFGIRVGIWRLVFGLGTTSPPAQHFS